MPVETLRERYTSKVGTVTIGATKDQGGTRTGVVTVGGDSTLPFLQFEGDIPNRPVIAMEVDDRNPDWNPSLKAEFGDEVMSDPARWAAKCVEAGADLIYLKLAGADPELENHSPEECSATVKKVLGAVGVPIIVVGCGVDEKDNAVLPAVAEAAAGENLLLGTAEQDNYKTLTASCMVHKHSIIALSPIDINICKQLNILINEMNLPLDRIVIDPSVGALGYGVEYTYSIMERIRLGALQGDRMLAMPVICNIGYESWRAKEANAGEDEFPGWGPQAERSILWEAATANSFLQAGGHILVMRNPKAVKLVAKLIGDLMVPNK
ncbi:MAG TPA: acetyl-CoA decarbonylase/synthase complex subunit delta [Bacillota bacterium]